MTSPRDVRGVAYLSHQLESKHTLWVYLPEQGKSFRIDPGLAARRGRIARTAISYEDLRYLPLNLTQPTGAETTDFTTTDFTVRDRQLSLVQLALPPGVGSLYDRIVSFVDPETCLPLRIEFEGLVGDTLKIATADSDTIERMEERWVARSTKIEDLQRGVVTNLVIEKMDIDPDLPDRIFDPKSQWSQCPKDLEPPEE
jgi:outer membrane lipoprotein-sorting protein